MARFWDSSGNLVIRPSALPGDTAIADPPSTNLVDLAPWMRGLDTHGGGAAGWHPAIYNSVGTEDPESVGGQLAVAVAAATVNFNNRNDRNGAAVVAPTIAADGTAVDHTANTDGTVNISFEWSWSGTNSDIDGFGIYIHQSTTATTYTFGTDPTTEQVYSVDSAKRAFLLYGVAADLYYTFGVRAYRQVDPDINAARVIQTSIVKPSLAAENPYRPSASVAFAGDVTGTVNGIAAANVNVWNAVTGTGKPADNATVGADFASNLANIPYATIYNNNGAAVMGFNPTFSEWSGAYPSGWGNYSGAAPTKETVLVRTGRFAVRYSPVGADLGMVMAVTWPSVAIGSSYVSGAFDARMVAYTSGGAPGIVVDLFVDAALTTIRRTIIPVTDKTMIGVWQRVPFTAGVNPGESIYGVRIYVMASWSGMPGGQNTSTVIFDNLQFDITPLKSRIHLVGNTATEVLFKESAPSFASGLTAGSPQVVVQSDNLPARTEGRVSGGVIVIQFACSIYGTSLSANRNLQFLLSRSSDNGATWSGEVTQITATAVAGNYTSVSTMSQHIPGAGDVAPYRYRIRVDPTVSFTESIQCFGHLTIFDAMR